MVLLLESLTSYQTFGKLLDPLADKLTQIFCIGTLSLCNIIPSFIFIFVIIKEFFMITGASILYKKDIIVYSKWYGKLATVLFYIAIVISFVKKVFPAIPYIETINLVLYGIAIFIAIFSFISYLLVTIRHKFSHV